ncbi:MAG TPA: DNA polymerase III subunit delta' [Blastocatellia bacterium]
MPFSTLIGNDRIKSMLKRAVAEGRIGQGLILAGPSGIGKRQFAIALAQAVNCGRTSAGDACGRCSSCMRIALGEHLDVASYSPDGQFIKIGQMREMSVEAHFKPLEGKRRVLIVDEADRLKIEAANSILKTLEEPPETSLVLLITSKPYALLDTIRSRCQLLSFAPLSTPDLEQFLGAEKRPAAETRLLARLSRGSIGRSKEIELDVYRERREIMLTLVESALVDDDCVRLINSIEYLTKKIDREDFVPAIDNLLILLADLFYLKMEAAAASVTNVDVIDRLGRVADKISVQHITELVDRIELFLRALPRNVSRQVGLESVFLTAAVPVQPIYALQAKGLI